MSDAGSTHSSIETSATSQTGEVSTPPGQSPPRQVERQATFAGNKPRPLRLVQDQAVASAEEKEKAAAKRGTWYGWATGAMKTLGKDGDGAGAEVQAGKE